MKPITPFLLMALLSVSTLASEKNNPHQFNGNMNDNKNNCLFCHISEEQSNTIAEPLWDRKIKDANFNFNSIASVSTKSLQKSEISKICLSCHDGSATENSHSYNLVSEGNESFNYSDPRLNHPVGMDYNSMLAFKNKKLYNPDTTPSGLGGTITQDLLYNGKMECTSCHYVHFDTSENQNGTLVMSNAGSNLCLTCHNM